MRHFDLCQMIKEARTRRYMCISNC